MNNRNLRKNNILRPKNVKLLTTGYSDSYHTLTTGFDGIRLELENENLRQMIQMLEGKNRVLEEHCNLLREKNLYIETRLNDAKSQLRDFQSGDISDQQQNHEQDKGKELANEEKSTSLIDRISGVVFGVALPKIGKIFGKIREKGKELKSLIEEHGDGEHVPRHCPMGGKHVDIKEKIEALKVNLFRVVVVLGSLMVLSGVGFAGYKIWKSRYRHPSYLIPSDDEEEDSGEELFRAPGTSGTSHSILKTNSTDSFETPGISTDFRSILDTASKK